MPAVAPYRPAGHGVQVPAPLKLYWPAGHKTAVALVLPAGQAYPAVHDTPEHVGAVRPVELPYCPALHGPEQRAETKPAIAPYVPAGRKETVIQKKTKKEPSSRTTHCACDSSCG
jgi:hypothetical protein